jgi:hypothetical protein
MNRTERKHAMNALERLPAAHWTPDTLAGVIRDATRLQSLAVAACNAELTPRQKANQKGAEHRLRAALEPLGVRVDVGGDPRGYVVKLHHPALPPNTWGGREGGHGLGGSF